MEFSDPFVYMGSVVCSIIDSATFKGFLSVIVMIFSFLFGIEYISILTGLLALITIDMITAILATKKTGEVISSRKSLRTSFKILVYSLAIIVSHLVDKCLGFPVIEYLVISYFTCSEAISNLENLSRLGYTMPAKALNLMKEKMENM